MMRIAQLDVYLIRGVLHLIQRHKVGSRWFCSADFESQLLYFKLPL
jgi:hypothetical protein